MEAERRPLTARDSADLFGQIAENVGEVLFVVDHRDYTVLYVNRAYEKIWGRTRESLYEDPNSWLDAIIPEDRERVKAALEKQQSTGEFSEEFCITQPDQSVRWIQDRVFQIRNSQGKLHRLVGIAEDITERKEEEHRRIELEGKLREEAELRRNEERYRVLAEAAQDLIYVLTPDGRIEFSNSYAAKMFGLDPEAIMGRDIEALFPSEVAAGQRRSLLTACG